MLFPGLNPSKKLSKLGDDLNAIVSCEFDCHQTHYQWDSGTVYSTSIKSLLKKSFLLFLLNNYLHRSYLLLGLKIPSIFLSFPSLL